ncbi:MAG TPA: hypothetical protein VMT35_19405, partial [Ignavibacteriaceae bacterium]|nr:hypothetical protein [Ignavibacteriaceae bacterium]
MQKILRSLLLILCFLPGSSISCQSKFTESAGLQLPEGFNAAILIDNIGRPRHLAITPEGNIYVKLERLVNGNGTLYLTQKNDKASVKFGFDKFGGTGIYIKNDYLYVSSNQEIFRYKLDKNH